MKAVFVLALLVATVAVTLGEPCRDNQACKQHGITQCGSGSHVVCHNHQCECTDGPNGKTCTAQADCTCDQGRHPHCIDGHCQCTRV